MLPFIILARARRLIRKFKTTDKRKRSAKDVKKLLDLYERYVKENSYIECLDKFAQEIGYSHSALRQWKSGCNTSGHLWPELAKYLGIENSKKYIEKLNKSLKDITIRLITGKNKEPRYEIDIPLPYPVNRKRIKSPLNLTKEQALDWGREQQRRIMSTIDEHEACNLAKKLRGRGEKNLQDIYRFFILFRDSGLSIKKWCKLVKFSESTFSYLKKCQRGNPPRDWPELRSVLYQNEIPPWERVKNTKPTRKTSKTKKENINILDINSLDAVEISSEGSDILITKVISPSDKIYAKLLSELVRRSRGYGP